MTMGTCGLPEGLPPPRNVASGADWSGLMVFRWGPSCVDSETYRTDRHELHLNLSGEVRSCITVGGAPQCIEARPQQFVAIAAGQDVRWTGAMKDAITVSIDPDRFASIAAGTFDADPGAFRPDPVVRPPDEAITGVIRRIAYHAARGAPSRLAAECLAREFAEALGRIGTGWRRRRPEGRRLTGRELARLDGYLDAHMREATLAGMAGACGIGSRQLLRAFRQTFGTTPVQHVLRLRLERARTLIATGGEPIAQIAAETGFHDQAHLTHAFRRVYGLPPGRHRAGPARAFGGDLRSGGQS